MKNRKNIKQLNEEIYLSSLETCELLKIKSATLWVFEKQGKIKGRRVGRRVLFLKSEVCELINNS